MNVVSEHTISLVRQLIVEGGTVRAGGGGARGDRLPSEGVAPRAGVIG